MFGVKGAGKELWLRAACLVASVGLHAGLGILGWQGLATTLPDSAPIMVTLAEGPGDEAPLPRQTASPGKPQTTVAPARKVVSSRPNPLPALQPVATVQPTTVESAEAVLQCALPESMVVEDENPSLAPEPAAGHGAGAGGVDGGAGGGAATGLSAGTAVGKGSESGGSAGRLVLAKPRYASNPKPEYPRLARQNHWEGVVSLRVAISAGGEVESVVVENSSGYQILDNSAVGGVRRWRFIPARRGDLRVPCEVRIPVAFQLDR